MSHNILHHYENAMLQKSRVAELDEYRQSLIAVLDSKYERLSRLKKVLEGYTFSRNRHQRYHESERDSLAVILLKRSNLAFKADYSSTSIAPIANTSSRCAIPLAAFFNAYHLPMRMAGHNGIATDSLPGPIRFRTPAPWPIR